MANGTISLSRTSGQYLTGRIQWSSVAGTTQENASVVTASLQVKKENTSTTSGTFTGSFTVGTVTEELSLFTQVAGSWVTIKTITATVSHDPDGTCLCRIQGKVNGPTQTTLQGAVVSGSQSVALDIIPRFAVLLSAPDFHDEEDPTISYTNSAGSTVASLRACISLDGPMDDIAYRDIPKTGKSYTFQLTEAERNVLRNATTGNSRSVIFSVRTVLGDVAQNSTLMRTFSIVNGAPSLEPTVTDTNPVTVALTGSASRLVRYFSNAAVTFGAAARKGATLKSRKVTCGGDTLTADGTFGAIQSGVFHFAATDSRGNTAEKTALTQCVDYVPLTCALENSMPDASGAMTVRVTGSAFQGSFGAKANTLQVQCRYRAYGAEGGTWQTMTLTWTGNAYEAAAQVTGLDYRTTYLFQARAQDLLDQVQTGEKAMKAAPVFDWSKEDFRFRVPVTLGAGAASGKLTPEEDLNSLKTNGWYYWDYGLAPQNIPADAAAQYMTALRVWTAAGGACCQELVDMSDSVNQGCAMRRTVYGDTAYPWEWVNPPMEAETEYRTTARCMQKPVYTKLVSLGPMPNASGLEKYGLAAGVERILSAEFMMTGSGLAYGGSHIGLDFAYAGISNHRIFVALRTNMDLSACSGHCLLRYCKV